MNAGYPPRPHDLSERRIEMTVAELVEQLRTLDVVVSQTPWGTGGPCVWCQEIGHDTAVAVYTVPDDDPWGPEPLQSTEACRCCTPNLARRAIVERHPSSRTPIQIEIGV